MVKDEIPVAPFWLRDHCHERAAAMLLLRFDDRTPKDPALLSALEDRTAFWREMEKPSPFNGIEQAVTKQGAVSFVGGDGIPEDPGLLIIRVEAEIMGTHPHLADWCARAERVKVLVTRCYGGDTPSAFHILASAGDKCVGSHVLEVAASAGALVVVLSEGKRTATPEARIMLHGCRLLTIGRAEEHIAAARYIVECNSALARRLQARTGQNADVVGGWLRQDSWFSAQQALDAHLIDAIEP